MSDYRPVLYHSQLSPGCARIKRTLRELGVEVEFRNILLSRRNRQELARVAGEVKVPCLVLSGSVVQETDEIVKYLHLRYGVKK